MTSEDKERTTSTKKLKKIHSRAPTQGAFIFYIVFNFIHTYN